MWNSLALGARRPPHWKYLGFLNTSSIENRKGSFQVFNHRHNRTKSRFLTSWYKLDLLLNIRSFLSLYTDHIITTKEVSQIFLKNLSFLGKFHCIRASARELGHIHEMFQRRHYQLQISIAKGKNQIRWKISSGHELQKGQSTSEKGMMFNEANFLFIYMDSVHHC